MLLERDEVHVKVQERIVSFLILVLYDDARSGLLVGLRDDVGRRQAMKRNIDSRTQSRYVVPSMVVSVEK